MISKAQCFILRHSMTVAAAAVLTVLIGLGKWDEKLTVSDCAVTIFILGGVIYALGWIRGNLDGLCQAAEEKDRRDKFYANEEK